MKPSKLLARDLMTRHVITLHRNQSVPLADALMRQAKIRHLPVIDDDRRVVGIVSDRDLLSAHVSALTSLSADERTDLELVVPVSRIMQDNVWTVRPETPVTEVVRLLLDNKFGCAPVVDDDQRLVGIVTEVDLLALLGAQVSSRARAPAHREVPVNYYMSEPVRSISPDDELELAQELMAAHGISSLAVVDAGVLVGVISQTDLVRVSVARAGVGAGRRALVLPTRRVRDVMTHEIATATAPEPVAVAAHRMIEREVHRLFVVEGRRPIGVLSTTDVTLAVRDMRIATPVSELMTQTLFTVGVGVTLAEAGVFLDQSGLHGVIVRDGDWPVGVFTQREALASRDLAPATGVEHVMSGRVVCVPARMPLYRVAGQVAALGARRVIAIEDGQLAGVLTGTDFARACARMAP